MFDSTGHATDRRSIDIGKVGFNMQIKKSGKKAYGAILTAAEKKAMEMEIKRQLAEFDRKHELEIDAVVLWLLHEEFGFGEKRLKKLYSRLKPAIDELINRYQMDEEDGPWLCTTKLKNYGIDLEEWKNEIGGNL